MEDWLDPRHCVANNLHQTARAVSRVFSEEMRESGLKRSQFAILMRLDSRGSQRLSTLAEDLWLDRTTMTRNLQPLEQEALVVIRPSDEDRRVREVEITATGRKRCKEALKMWRRAQKRMVSAYGAERWSALETALRELRHIEA